MDKPHFNGYKVGELLDFFPENAPLYKDSGRWVMYDDDMTEPLVDQIITEKLRDFIIRCIHFDMDKYPEHYQNGF